VPGQTKRIPYNSSICVIGEIRGLQKIFYNFTPQFLERESEVKQQTTRKKTKNLALICGSAVSAQSAPGTISGNTSSISRTGTSN